MNIVNEQFEKKHDLLARVTPGGAENFITEVFCWLLEYSDFDRHFLSVLAKRCDFEKPPSSPIFHNPEWTTQESYRLEDGRKKRPDMICKSSTCTGTEALIFEHKVWSPVREDQLKYYQEIGDNDFKWFRLILITSSEHHPSEEKPYSRLLWRDIYKWIDEWLPQCLDDTISFVAQCFLEVLKERGIGPMNKIQEGQLAALPSQIRAQRKLKETQDGLMTMIKRAAQNEKFKQLKGINLEPNSGFIMESKNFRWGRFGYYLPIDQPDTSGQFWNPGIFIGVLCDDFDHGPNFVTEVDGEGPIACLIMSINKPWHDKYKKSDEFRGLVDKLHECWPATSTKSWQVYEDRETRNIWHPVFIYKPLKDLFRENETGDDQVECFAKEMSEIASAVLELDEFCRFKKSLT